MTPNQIETMIDRIVALFPSSTIPRNTIKTGWVQDDFLLDADVADGRKALEILRDTYVKFPSLKEVHNAFRRVQSTTTAEVSAGCILCDNTGWDTGITADEPQGYRKSFGGYEYSFVKRCRCSS